MSGGVPAGWVLVPVEPTQEMLNAAVDATEAGAGMSWNGRSPQKLFQQAHAAMLAATPTPPIEGRDADVGRVLTVLRNLEAACDDLAANRSNETYRNMIDCDRATPYLHALDEARRDARAALQALGERG